MKTPPQKRKTQSEMQLARTRLRGALNESLHDDAEEEDTTTDSICNNLPARGRPPKNLHSLQQSPRSSTRPSPTKQLTAGKRRKRELQLAALQYQKIQAESFVMKLFDRSLDLSKYTEQTALYPICRAWMANQPRNPSIRSYRSQRSPSPVERKANGTELLAKLKRGELTNGISVMPAPKKTELSEIPPNDSDTIDDSIEETPEEELTKEALLAKHVNKWKQLKTNWRNHTKLYQQQRYEVNHQIIQELFKP